MTHPPAAVTDPDPEDLVWETLAQELTPATSLARIDAAAARVVTNITLIGTILTGLGLIAIGLPTTHALVRQLAAAAVITAVLAVGCALVAQILTIRRHFNTANLIEVEAWYRRQFQARAYPTRAATLLLLAALLLAGGATATTLLDDSRSQPTLAITQTQTTDGGSTAAGATDQNRTRITLNVEVTFRGMTDTDTAILTVTTSPPTPGTVLARAAITPNIDGTATRTVTIDNIPRQTTVDVTAHSSHHQCHAYLDLIASNAPTVICNVAGS